MELIPIFAFVILAITISTFVFAIGAYIMYKVRESRGNVHQVTAKQVTTTVEAVRPNPVVVSQEEAVHSNGHTNGHTNGHSNGHTNGHTNGHSNGHSNGHTNGHSNGHPQYQHPENPNPAQQQPYYPQVDANPMPQAPNNNGNGQPPEQKQDGQTPDGKFQRYTPNGYVYFSKNGKGVQWR